MADDGLLMNFALGDDLLGVKSVFKGGRWKDRLQAKKSLQRRKKGNNSGSKALTGSNAVPTKPKEVVDDQVPRPAKKQRLNGTTFMSNKTSTKPKEVVSSLFTYNPSSKVPASTQTQSEQVPAPEPSNAPLPASASPFTSLGLSPFLSTHLTQNLSLCAPTAIQKAAITQLLREDSDAFIQAETGSGKTLAYLLPILQRILTLSNPSLESSPTGGDKARKLDRSSGLFALILAPTRELTHQISSVLTRLLRPLPWLVAGTVTGGSTKNHEKSRIRKGINILIATPGRLADHLEHTEALDMSSVRWLVLDEGDRLMELGFEEEIKDIVKRLEEAQGKKRPGRVNIVGLPERRTTVLCSATMKMGVQKLGEISLKDAVHIKADAPTPQSTATPQGVEERQQQKEKAFLAPAQLKQSYTVVPPKQRLVTLAALLKRTFARKGSVMKAIVFLSCADSVDFHFEIFTRKEAQPPEETSSSRQNTQSNDMSSNAEIQDPSLLRESSNRAKSTKQKPDLSTIAPAPTLASPSNPDLKLYRLHGSLEQKIRTATLQSFTRSTDPSILLCTDVASRGLDLPNIDLVIEYDPPFSSDDHLHRVGRTARAGKEGQACCFLMPGPEEGYISILRDCAGEGFVKGEKAEDVLRKGFTSSISKDNNKNDTTSAGRWDDIATEYQLSIERWIIADTRASDMAKKAFISHVRAYATHVVKERRIFDVKALHLGHLAKAFALRERPGGMGRGGPSGSHEGSNGRRGQGGEKTMRRRSGDSGEGDGKSSQRADIVDMHDGQEDAARKMRAKMKEQAIAGGGAGEFNIG
ncbi:hypothetical protein JMJ35_005256 [Cladonia borealis]|uniref:ATP-dependent RNA helicase n=1 Tax=Cladonia borealis TaxID=184061 RepID=A0AA39V1C8_9LECA|nr:hypothetical protein JMJ35_005256 [Cladonia borealis]